MKCGYGRNFNVEMLRKQEKKCLETRRKTTKIKMPSFIQGLFYGLKCNPFLSLFIHSSVCSFNKYRLSASSVLVAELGPDYGQRKSPFVRSLFLEVFSLVGKMDFIQYITFLVFV